MATKIKLKRGTSAQWAASTVPLAAGEIGLDTTLGKMKFGNGTSLWSSLSFFHATLGDLTFAFDSAKAYTDLAVNSLSNTAGTIYVPLSDVGQVDGVASLDANGKIPDSEIPATIARDTEVTSAASAAVTAAVTAAVAQAGTAADTKISTAINSLVNAAPATLNTLNELAAAINNDFSYAATITTALGTKAPIAGPAFTGAVTIPTLNVTTTATGITKSMVGLSNVDNTSDANKPVSTANQTALNLKLNISDQSFDYVITNSGTGGYVVNGILNGNMYFTKGKKYNIKVNASGHPFWIQTVFGAYSANDVYSTGVTNGGTDNGIITFDYSIDGPTSLYYACQYHSSMKGAIIASLENDTVIKSVSGSYTVISEDINKIIEMSSGGTVTITDSTSFPIGCSIDILQTGSSQVTIAGNGFTPNATPGLKLRAQWSSATLLKRGLNSWVILGDLAV